MFKDADATSNSDYPVDPPVFVHRSDNTNMNSTSQETTGVVESGQSEQPIGFLDISVALVRHGRVIALITACCAVLAVIISLLLPNKYTAEAKILPPQQSESFASAILGQFGPLGAMAGKEVLGKEMGLKSPNDIFVGMLQSRSIQDALITRFNLQQVYGTRTMADARSELANYTDIKTAKGGLITVQVEDRDRKRAPALANAYIDELIALNRRIAVSEASQRRMFFEQQFAAAKEQLADAEVAFKQTQERTGLIHIDSQAKAIIESVALVRAQVATKEVQLAAMRSFATQQNPDYILLNQQLAALRSQLAGLEQQQNRVSGDIFVPTGNVPELSLEYVRKLRDVKYFESMYELLAKQVEIAKIDESKNAAIIQVLDKAVEPERKSSPKRSLFLIGGLLAGFVCGCVYVLLLSMLNGARMDPSGAAKIDEIKRHLFRRKQDKLIF